MASNNRKIKNYVSKRNLVLSKSGHIGTYDIKIYLPTNGGSIGCIAVLDDELELTILEHNFDIPPSISLSKNTHFESHEIMTQTGSMYTTRGDYMAIYGTKDIGRDVDDYTTVLFTTDSKGNVNTYWMNDYNGSYTLTKVSCKTLGFELDWRETRTK